MSEPIPCHYTTLGLAKDATLSDIKKAFRKLALEFHPDKVQGEAAKEANSKRFQKVNEAYGVLSDDEKRLDYDDRVRLQELRKRAKGEANISVPRTPTAHYDVRCAEPRPDTFRAKSTTRTTPSTSNKFYSQYPPSASRSYEEDIYTARHYEEVPRAPRRTPSYDEKPSKREEERERERRRKEDSEERAKAARAAERKEKDRRAEKDAKKLKEKQRKKDGEEKRIYRESYPEEDEALRASKSDKKKSSSSSKKHEDRDKREREKSIPRDLVVDETIIADRSAQYHMMAAAQYINASRSKVSNPPPLSRASTFQDYSHRYAIPPVAVPTPPCAQEAPFPPPMPPMVSVEEDSEEDLPRRSSAKPSARRSSDTPKVRERSTHKKSGSGSRDYIEVPPIPIIEGHARMPPQFLKAGSTPPKVPDSPPRHPKPSRAHTLREADFVRPVQAQPPLSRSSTYHYGEFESREPRGRDRSRFQSQVEEESDSEDDPRYESMRRERRHRTRSPEVLIPAEYPPPPHRAPATRYGIKKEGRVPMTAEPTYYYPEEASPPSRKSKGATYYEPYARSPETRPPMPSRSSGYSSSGGYLPTKIKTAQSYTPDDVQYSQMPAYREAAYGWA